jgi:Tfp pilus assembly protein PilZ
MGALLSVDDELGKKVELRKYPRIPARFPVQYTLGKTTERGHASTLGGGGMFIEDSGTLPKSAEVQVQFRPAKHLPFLQAKARVIYVVPSRGSGVEFTDISQEHHQLILRLIHHKTANRRENPRVALATQIHIQDSMSLAYSRDVSVGGIFVETKMPYEIGTRMDLRFHLNDGGPVVIAKGEVRYIVPKMGLGVQFLDLSRGDRQRIEELIASSPEVLPDPNTPNPPAT